jgi:hypothetical protein
VNENIDNHITRVYNHIKGHNTREMGVIQMSFMCIMKKKLLQGKLTTNYKHKCFKCDGSGRNCLTGYNLYLEYIKQQNEGGK